MILAGQMWIRDQRKKEGIYLGVKKEKFGIRLD